MIITTAPSLLVVAVGEDKMTILYYSYSLYSVGYLVSFMCGVESISPVR